MAGVGQTLTEDGIDLGQSVPGLRVERRHSGRLPTDLQSEAVLGPGPPLLDGLGGGGQGGHAGRGGGLGDLQPHPPGPDLGPDEAAVLVLVSGHCGLAGGVWLGRHFLR